MVNPANPSSWTLIALYMTYTVNGANWAQLSGRKRQHIATPYIPTRQHYRDATSVLRPMWTGRWGHAVTVFNQTSYHRNDLTIEEHSKRLNNIAPQLILLGGDDYGYEDSDAVVIDSDSTTGGFRNDVWASELSPKSSLWTLDERFKPQGTKLHDATVRSAMQWRQTNPGYEAPKIWPANHPNFGQLMPYNDWIRCQDYFQSQVRDETLCDILQSSNTGEVMWSPRRGHTAVVANNALYIIGGRARENVVGTDARIVGGASMIDTPNINELSVLKNDVWVSHDGLGKKWKLVTPGCMDQQEDILLQTEIWSQNMNADGNPTVGPHGSKCIQSSDCFGQAECKKLGKSTYKICVCPMFGVREHHAVTVQRRSFVREDGTKVSEDYIYVVGGFTNVRQGFCNDRPCGSQGSYRVALDDAWVSTDGYSWVQIKPAQISNYNLFKGRGGHATLIIQSNQFVESEYQAHDRLWMLGGQTSNPNTEGVEYLNDIWSLDLETEPCCRWHDNCSIGLIQLQVSDIGSCLPYSSNWTLQIQHASWDGRSGHTVVHEPPSDYNGFNDRVYLIGGRNNITTLADVWTSIQLMNGTWHEDFKTNQLSRIGDKGASLSYLSMDHSPFQYYFDANSPLSSMRHSHQPLATKMSMTRHNFLVSRPLLSDEDIKEAENLDIYTIDDLHSADIYKILKLRDTVSNICYLKTLVQEFLQKCTMHTNKIHNYENQAITEGKWLLTSCEQLQNEDRDFCIARGWDGCTPIPGYPSINVHGLGNVSVPSESFDVSRDLEEMHCRQVPGERYMAAGQFVQGKIFILGGQGRHEKELHQDVWAREDHFPVAQIVTKPLSYTPQSKFTFESNIDGALQFQYKLFDPVERWDVTPWLATTINDEVDISWLDRKKGGPGSGWYTLYVRAVTPSGNRDFTYSNSSNVHNWYYVQPLPWGAISAAIVVFVILISAAYFEYRRRERKAALERYAARRRRRQFKLQVMNDHKNTLNKYEREKYRNASNILLHKDNDEENQGKNKTPNNSLFHRKKVNEIMFAPDGNQRRYGHVENDLVSRIHTIQKNNQLEEEAKRRAKRHKNRRSNQKIKPV